MLTQLEIGKNLNRVVMIYPLQILLIGVLSLLGLYVLYHSTNTNKDFNQRNNKFLK